MDGRSLDPQAHATRIVEMVRMARRGELPPTVFNHAFWLLAAERGEPGFEERWFDADGTAHLPAVDALNAIDKGALPTGSESAPVAKTPVAVRSKEARVSTKRAPAPKMDQGNGAGQNDKFIDHYLLLPLFEWGTTLWHISIVQEYIEAFLPTCGFSVQDAKMARQVTIIGNVQGVSARDEQALVAAGCRVERIAGQSGDETQQMLQELARNKQQSRGKGRK
jgi:hypothetical protein